MLKYELKKLSEIGGSPLKNFTFKNCLYKNSNFTKSFPKLEFNNSTMDNNINSIRFINKINDAYYLFIYLNRFKDYFFVFDNFKK